MQDDRLFAGTLAENIAVFDAAADQNRVEVAAQQGGNAPDIRKMPMGFNTLVGDMGSALSGGQRQRLLLARALYKEPRALFLDEATSHLDAASEAAVNATLAHLRMTRIVIAHKAQTIGAMDRVVLLGSGKVVRDTPVERLGQPPCGGREDTTATCGATT